MFRFISILALFMAVCSFAYAQNESDTIQQSESILNSAEALLEDIDDNNPASVSKTPETIENLKSVDSVKPPESLSNIPETQAGLRLEFEAERDGLSAEHVKRLNQDILPRLKNQQSRVVEISSFATSPDPGQSGSRRISLARAIAVQDHLRAQGVDERQIYLRPMGAVSDRGDMMALRVRAR